MKTIDSDTSSSNIHPDPMPDTSPQDFLEAVYKAVAHERKRLHIAPEDAIDLALIVDNAHVSAFLADNDVWGYPIIETLSGATNSLSLYQRYSRPLDTDLSKGDKIDPSKHSFDLTKPATKTVLGNVAFAVSIGKSHHKTASYAGVTGIRLVRWSGAGQFFVQQGTMQQASDGMVTILTTGYTDTFDEEAFKKSKPFGKAMQITNSYSDQIFQGIVQEARKYGNMPHATDEEVKAHLFPQVLTVIDEIKDGLPYVAYSFTSSWSAIFTVITHKATIISANNQTTVSSAPNDPARDETDIPLLKRLGAKPETIAEMVNYPNGKSAHLYAPSGKQLHINKAGKQTTKIFFEPKVRVTTRAGVKDLPQNWAGRILPGQTIADGIAAELKEVYGYDGVFEYSAIYFLEYAQDRKGRDIERYAITINLLPTPDEERQLGL